MEHPKILFIHHGKGIGGAPLSLLYLVEGLLKTTYKPLVVFLHDSDAMTLFKKKNIPIRPQPINRYDFSHTKIWWFCWYHPGYLIRAVFDTIITLFFTAPRVYHEEKPAIVHLNTSSLIAWGLAAKWRKIPVVWHIREPLADGYLGIRKALITKCIAYAATQIVAISKHDAGPWQHLKKTSVVYNAVPTELFNYSTPTKLFLKKHAIPAEPLILFVGGLSREKGTLTILKAFELLVKTIPSAQLLIAGYLPKYKRTFINTFTPGGKYAKQVDSLLTKLHKNIILLGPINTMPEAMAAADVIVFPASVGHFARPIIEAGFMQKPVIASNLPPLDELVINMKTGYLLPSVDYQAWAKNLHELLIKKQAARAIGLHGFSYCTKTFSLPQQIIKIMHLYDEILKRRNA